MNDKKTASKKKILFIMPSMFIGGAERSLLGLMDSFDYSRYDVYLFLYRHEGEFYDLITEQVNVLDEIDKYRTFDVPIKSLLFGKKALFGLARMFSKVALKIHCTITGEKRGLWMSMQYTSRFLQPLLPDIPGNYDAAVMFQGVPDTLINKVQAKRKICWCHTDYDSQYPDRKRDRELYEKLDYIVGVSDACRDKIREYYPEFSDKIITIENIISKKLIEKQAEEQIKDMPASQDEKILLSIGRFSTAKNFDNVPYICKTILARGVKVRWYLIGYGGDEKLIRSNISEAEMDDNVILLGMRTNPYPYIKKCDVYVQPSRWEGKSVAVREAQILSKPVIITDYQTAHDQIKNAEDGMIVPMENEACGKAIADVLNDVNLLERLHLNCIQNDYSNAPEIEKLYSII